LAPSDQVVVYNGVGTLDSHQGGSSVVDSSERTGATGGPRDLGAALAELQEGRYAGLS
jgi:hypothetical protein